MILLTEEERVMNCPQCGKPMILWQSSFKPFSYRCLPCKLIVVETV